MHCYILHYKEECVAQIVIFYITMENMSHILTYSTIQQRMCRIYSFILHYNGEYIAYIDIFYAIKENISTTAPPPPMTISRLRSPRHSRLARQTRKICPRQPRPPALSRNFII